MLGRFLLLFDRRTLSRSRSAVKCLLFQQCIFPRFLAFLFLLVFVLAAERKVIYAEIYSDPVKVDWTNVIYRSRLAGLNVFQSDHLVLITDHPRRADDDIKLLPEVFDEAVNVWASHYSIPLSVVSEWKVCGCLIVDRERFREAGLLPDTIQISRMAIATITGFGLSINLIQHINAILCYTKACMHLLQHC